MWDLIAFAALFIVLPVLLLGAPFFVARKRWQVSRLVATFLSAVISSLIIGAPLWATNECMQSSYMKKTLPTMLTPEEAATLSGEDLFCSTTFSFERRGKRASAFIVGGLLRDKIYIADDRGP